MDSRDMDGSLARLMLEEAKAGKQEDALKKDVMEVRPVPACQQRLLHLAWPRAPAAQPCRLIACSSLQVLLENVNRQFWDEHNPARQTPRPKDPGRGHPLARLHAP